MTRDDRWRRHLHAARGASSSSTRSGWSSSKRSRSATSGSRSTTARKTLLVDETGIPEETPLTEISVNWYGPDDACYAIARQWFATEFGISFIEARRRMPVFVVRRKGE